MKFVSISDLHIREQDDDAHQFLKSFFRHQKVLEAEVVFFLGDIFDLMVGEHDEYVVKYSFFFNELQSLLDKGKTVVFFEGNHDLHIKKLFLNNLRFSPSQLKVIDNQYVIQWSGKLFYFSHGDNFPIGDWNYKIYKFFLTSLPMKLLVNKIFSFNFIEKVGQKASKASRDHGTKNFDFSTSKEIFREGAKKIAKRGYDFIIAGHSHIIDYYEQENFVYINNGFPVKDRKFIFFDGKDVELASVD